MVCPNSIQTYQNSANVRFVRGPLEATDRAAQFRVAGCFFAHLYSAHEESRDRGDRWKPRVVVEAKLGKVTTNDAITYSQKASTHRAVHPYLRYGIMLGDLFAQEEITKL